MKKLLSLCLLSAGLLAISLPVNAQRSEWSPWSRYKITSNGGTSYTCHYKRSNYRTGAVDYKTTAGWLDRYGVRCSGG